MKTTMWVGAAAFVLAASTGVFAKGNKPCIDDAQQTKKECQAGCRDDYQSAKDGCINKDHLCVESCRDGRQACIDATGLQTQIDACNATLAGARAQCRQTFPAGPDRDKCIDQAQLVAFQCRQTARRAAAKSVKACRTGFKSCVVACPPGNGPSDDPKACRDSATQAFVGCQGDCKESFQVQIDACKNRDHNCVEQCRTDRESCLAPVTAQLAAAIAACNATRDQALANCHQLYGGAGEEQDLAQCIENARVAAFVCRDDAHEAAHPGIKACRDAFGTCAKACPPIS